MARGLMGLGDSVIWFCANIMEALALLVLGTVEVVVWEPWPPMLLGCRDVEAVLGEPWSGFCW